jgi:prefoldin subunit 5
MKKGLLTVLAASLVFVGCQNYDDQFDDLNAQISVLKSQVDGLSSLSGQVASLSGTISGLQAGVSAAASSSELSGLSSSLAALQSQVDAVQASLASTATASAVTALQAEIDAIEADLDDLLETSNIYSSDVSVTNATTLNAALALGNKINVLNASMTITGYAGMSYSDVQTLVDRVNTTTGNIVYTAASATGTEIVFNNLTSAADITMTQPGGYSFPKLSNAGTIDLKDDYETTVAHVSFPALTTATAVQTDASGTMEVIFTYATNVDFGALATAPSNTITITTKKDATLDLGSWVSKDAAGNYVNATVTLNGPASFTNGTAAGTFASTGLPGNTLGAHDGTITLTNVATAAVHNFRGTIDINAGVKNFTGNNVVSADIAGAVALESINMTMIRLNTPGQTAATVANLDDSDDNTSQDLAFTATHAKLASATITGKAGDITFTSVPLLATVDLTGADAFVVSASGNASLTSWTDASKAEDRTFSDNDLMTSVSLSATTKLTATGDTAVSVTVSGNAELTSLTLGMDDVSVLNITSNPKLATLSGATAVKDNGTATTTDVDIHQNAFVASSIKDIKEDGSTTVTAGSTADTGEITTSSGLKDLDAYLTDAIAASGTVSVWFDTVTKLETQAAFGGVYTDQTANLTAPTAWDDTTARTNAATFSGGFEGYYAYVFQFDGTTATTTSVTTGNRDAQVITNIFDVGRNTPAYTDKLLATNEGFTVSYTNGSTTFKQGDTYNGSTVTTVDDLVAYINADTTLDALGIDLQADRNAFKQTLLAMTFSISDDNGLTQTAGAISAAGRIAYNVTTTETGATSTIYAASATADDAVAALTLDLRDALQAHNFSAGTGTDGNQLLVSRMVSGGTTTDRSPLSSIVTVAPVIDAAQTSTVATFLKGDTVSNLAAQTSGNFTFSVSSTELKGVRITMKNVGTGAFAAAVSLRPAAVSNTAIIANDGTVAGPGNAAGNGAADLLILGTNAPSFANYADIQQYVTGFTDITAGTTTTTTTGSTVAAVTTNRTGW